MGQIKSGAEYAGRHFSGLHLEPQSISQTEFIDCSFDGCILREVQFDGCRFSDCRFAGCDLGLAGLNGSTLQQVEFFECKLIGIDWTAVSWSKYMSRSPVLFKESQLDYGTFIGLALRQISFEGCSLKDIDFSEADLRGADFSRTILDLSAFRHTNLTGANFEGASGYTIDVMLNEISKARFSMPEAMALLHSLDIVLVD